MTRKKVVLIALVALLLGAAVLTWFGVPQALLLGRQDVSLPSAAIEVPEAWSDALLGAVLEAHVSEQGRVNYEALCKDKRLGQYVALLAKVSPETHPGLFPDQKHRLAYYINAYNALVLWGVVQHWPLSSVQDVSSGGLVEAKPGQGFFYSLRFVLGGQSMNLYDLENVTIRGFGDARIHAAINCASVGCPRLLRTPFRGSALEEDLEHAMRGMVAEPRNLSVDHEAKTVKASSIFDWFREDFVVGDASLLEYWVKFAQGDLANSLKKAQTEGYTVVFVPYDWGVNVKSP